ncbi:MAG TPA: glutathione S-transferase N-terminal domain-containing protein [Alphaproteobacteria bacterium]|nr:glutathione S-transferase N-terminal domain-containing protein [Alphaproteobacteria bacterium]MDP6269341.1 glutathione S-transferase N-terminal domain-containing protein [Alphaproteobacteria bacterium]MDP7164595.1 glutathione S-transferase N-terminal domain-containing protein [Alphaproteobacteria bacterium]HJM48751.1 glutathione S-transferase N-terminal domain-containing protein [Alphaproteobacteria bacterium]
MPAPTRGVEIMIKLYQFPPGWGLPSYSPFCLKLETWLRLTALPYEVVDEPDPRKGPKAKLPYIDDGGTVLGDSGLIIDYISRPSTPSTSMPTWSRAGAAWPRRWATSSRTAFIGAPSSIRAGPSRPTGKSSSRSTSPPCPPPCVR